MKQVYYHIALPIILALAVNVWLFKTKQAHITNVNPWIPSGYVIATIWTIILGLLGYTHYLVYSANKSSVSLSSLAIVFYVLWSISYPFLTGLYNTQYASILNKLSFAFAVILALIVNAAKRSATKYLAPLLVWVSYVNIVTL